MGKLNLLIVTLLILSSISFSKDTLITQSGLSLNQLEIIKENQSLQIQNLRNELDIFRNYYNRELELRSSYADTRLNIYLSFVIGGFAFFGFLITFFGKRTLTNWIKNYSDNKVSEIIGQKISELNVENAIREKSDELINKLLQEIELKGKMRLNEIDSLKQEYISVLSSLNENDDKRPVTNGTKLSVEKLQKYEKIVDELKDKKDFSFNDWYYKGLSEFEKSNNMKALNYWKKALEINPSSFMILTNIGIIFNRIGQPKLAIEYYDKAIDVNPSSHEPHIGKGNVYFDQNDNEKAIQEYTTATKLYPDYWGSYFNRGLAYHNIGEFAKAIEDYNKSLELNPHYSETYFRIGKVCEAEKDYQKAIINYTKAIEIEPINYNYFERRAISYYKLKNYEKSLEDYKKVLELEIENTSTSLTICELQIILNNSKDALENVNNIFNYPLFGGYKILAYFLKLITEIVLGLDYNTSKAKVQELFEKQEKVSWDFEDIIIWLNNANITKQEKELIKDIISKIKK